MPARLILHIPRRAGHIVGLDEGKVYVVGRDPSSDIVVEDDRVSRRHSTLAKGQSGWALSDQNSKNGTAVDGIPVRGVVPLAQPCWVSFGGVMARFEPEAAALSALEAEARLRRWQTSAQLARGLDPQAGLPEILRRLLGSILTLSGAQRGFVVLALPQEPMNIAATVGVSGAELDDRKFSGSLGAVQSALESSSAVVISDAQSDEALARRESVISGQLRSIICLPLKAAGRTLGVLYADSKETGPGLVELDVEILEALASQAAMAIWVARLDREVKGLIQQMQPSTSRANSLSWDDASVHPGGGGFKETWRGMVSRLPALEGNRP